MKLIVGLGNPGKEYEYTRHNIGFMVIDAYLGAIKYSEKMSAFSAEKNINNEKVIFIKPTTFMNNSGLAVRKYVDYYNIDLKDILIIQDDLDEEVGQYKLKYKSSHGGHNGMRSILSALKSDEIARLKIGIKTEKKDNVIDFVLGKFSKKEMDVFNQNIDTFKEIIDSFINYGIEKTMNVYNTK